MVQRERLGSFMLHVAMHTNIPEYQGKDVVTLPRPPIPCGNI